MTYWQSCRYRSYEIARQNRTQTCQRSQYPSRATTDFKIHFKSNLNHVFLGLKLIKQVMKDGVGNSPGKEVRKIYKMQCGFMSVRGPTDTSSNVHQLSEKHLAASKPLYKAALTF